MGIKLANRNFPLRTVLDSLQCWRNSGTPERGVWDLTIGQMLLTFILGMFHIF